MPSVWSLNSCWGFNSSSQQKGEGSFLMPYCLGLLLPFPFWPNQASGGLSPRALTLLGGPSFITWYLRCPFLGECQWGPRHFWKCQLMGPRHCWEYRPCLGYCPVPRPTLKKAMCHTCLFGVALDKYHLEVKSIESCGILNSCEEDKFVNSPIIAFKSQISIDYFSFKSRKMFVSCRKRQIKLL